MGEIFIYDYNYFWFLIASSSAALNFESLPQTSEVISLPLIANEGVPVTFAFDPTAWSNLILALTFSLSISFLNLVNIEF